jgi:hypothetical protein
MTWGPTGNLTREVEAPCEGESHGALMFESRVMLGITLTMRDLLSTLVNKGSIRRFR